jgi:hypothetical protein
VVILGRRGVLLILEQLLESLFLLRGAGESQCDVVDGEIGWDGAGITGRDSPLGMVMGQRLHKRRIEDPWKPVGRLSTCRVRRRRNGCKCKQHCELQPVSRSHRGGTPPSLGSKKVVNPNLRRVS